MVLLGSLSASLLFACGAATVSYFLIRHSRRKLQRSGDSPSANAGTIPGFTAHLPPPAAPLATRPGPAGPGSVEVHEMVRDLSAQLDSKMVLLQSLVRLADETAARLESAVARAEQLANAGSESFPSEPRPLPPTSPEKTEWPPVEQVRRLADSGYSAAAIAAALRLALDDVELWLGRRG